MSRFVSVALLVLVIAVGGHTQSAAPAKSDSHAYYSKGQADAGKALYAQNCSKCHLETLKGSCAAEMASRPKTYVCAGEGTALGAVYTPLVLIVPKVELLPTTPFTVQVTPRFEVPTMPR